MKRRIQKECESGCEYILPDYMGDIKKLLFYRAKAIPTGKFVGEGNVEVSGVVEYEVLYADSDGRLTAVNASSDFSESFSVDSERYVDSLEESKATNLKIRVTGPRKITMKAGVENLLTISEDGGFAVGGEAFSQNSDTLEKCVKEIRLANSFFKKSGEREYAEVIERLDYADKDDVEVISANAVTHVTEAVAMDGEIRLTGENLVSAILQIGEKPPFSVIKSIPFDEVISAEEVKSEMSVLANGVVLSATVSIGSENEECVAVANIITEYGVEAVENTSVNVVLDAYLTDAPTKNEYSDTEFSESVFNGIKDFYIEVAQDREAEKTSELCAILAASAEFRAVETSLNKGSCEFCGELTVSGVGYEANVDGSITYVPVKIQVPFKEYVNLGCQNSEFSLLEYDLTVKDITPKIDADGLSVRCLASAKLSLLSEGKIKRLSSLERKESEGENKDSSVVTVYYPKPNERLFDVAKRYRTTAKKIAEDNELSESVIFTPDAEDSLSGVKRLIIR